MLGVMLAAIGVLLGAPGVVQLFAGIRGRQFRNRWLVFVGLLAGVPALMLCTCFAVTAIPLAAWGLVLLYDPAVRARFEQAQAGAM